MEAYLRGDGGECDERVVHCGDWLVEAVLHPLVESVVEADHQAGNEPFVGLGLQDEAGVVEGEV